MNVYWPLATAISRCASSSQVQASPVPSRRPWKNSKLVASGAVVALSSAWTTTCMWPLMLLDVSHRLGPPSPKEDLPILVQLLRTRVVRGLCVGEGARVKTGLRDRDVDIGIGFDLGTIGLRVSNSYHECQTLPTGEVMRLVTMLLTEGMSPMGIGLQSARFVISKSGRLTCSCLPCSADRS